MSNPHHQIAPNQKAALTPSTHLVQGGRSNENMPKNERYKHIFHVTLSIIKHCFFQAVCDFFLYLVFFQQLESVCQLLVAGRRLFYLLYPSPISGQFHGWVVRQSHRGLN